MADAVRDSRPEGHLPPERKAREHSYGDDDPEDELARADHVVLLHLLGGVGGSAGGRGGDDGAVEGVEEAEGAVRLVAAGARGESIRDDGVNLGAGCANESLRIFGGGHCWRDQLVYQKRQRDFCSVFLCRGEEEDSNGVTDWATW